MPVTYEFRPDGRIAFVRDAAGKVLQDTFGGGAPSPGIQVRHDAADHPDRATASGARAAALITSAAQLREVLGLRGPPPPRQGSAMRYDDRGLSAAAAALPGAIRSNAQLRAALGERPPLVLRRPPENPPADVMRQDAAPAGSGFGPVRSSAELRARLGMPAR